MKLLAVRDLNKEDPLPPLGKKVEPPKSLEPVKPLERLVTNPQIVVDSDGRLRTDIPDNEAARFRSA